MQGSVERVRAVINGEVPDRAPIYEIFRNDSVISHFAGETLTVENGAEVVSKAYAPSVDATRPLVRIPKEERTVVLEDGRKKRYFRWRAWTEPFSYADSESYASEKRRYINEFDPSWNKQKQQELESALTSIDQERQRLGEVFFFPITGPRMGISYLYLKYGGMRC